ncbi:MAG: monofunctional biosynthetic peptidoglycan transglycosylase, partial [Gammaproteobacteria bacterium]|nr:monofunctional biosynthetic peptidoglycan transglycosylase [Gammaproteobacteria bacterium]
MAARVAGWLLRAALAALALLLLSVLLLRWVPPPTTAFMLADRAGAMLEGDFAYRNRYDWVPLEDISPQAALAVIASEDQRFPFHAGFDFESIRKAVRYNERAAARGRPLRGASTLTQQVAKNLFLWSGRSWPRKALEAGITLLIEGLWPKERILEVYLNVAEFGRGTYGVQAAAQRFFRKDAKRLTRREAATLAAVLPN